MKVLPQERERGRAFSWLPNRHHTPTVQRCSSVAWWQDFVGVGAKT